MESVILTLAHKISLVLSERTLICYDCQFIIDRDVNAARNLKNVALEFRETPNACGDTVRPEASLKLMAHVYEAGIQQPAMRLAGVW